jgi:hypothetical protein
MIIFINYFPIKNQLIILDRCQRNLDGGISLINCCFIYFVEFNLYLFQVRQNEITIVLLKFIVLVFCLN